MSMCSICSAAACDAHWHASTAPRSSTSAPSLRAVTGQAATEEEIDKMIETGESETIFQKAILEQGRGYVSGGGSSGGTVFGGLEQGRAFRAGLWCP